ncbi:hypothetical protein NQ317_013723 [Molorchus minor]|uniref:Uncharacterized protein n=1 Tax=Molorchus minor TaxID=1323400 RepID=A0ABQ9JQY4_9CUCU|nr:hypothetical protein NQ317_013723 [Molorchus minor]
MFYIKEPSSVGSPWTLSQMKDDKTVSISRNTIEDLKNYHVLGIEFLYRSYRKQVRRYLTFFSSVLKIILSLKGAILNEEEDLNMHLQVSAFLNAIYNHAERKLVLVVTPDKSIVCWHYNLTKHGGLNVQIITPHTCPEDFDQEHGLVILLRFTDIKLAEYLIDYNYLSVIIDNFDEIATKMIVKKLHGTFNIGLTRRNFYIDPNQKLQWAMLNWSNPGCVGKLTDFYEIDNDNFANFRDNYRHWWFRLTWSFSESFKEPTCEGKQEYMRTLSKWAVAYNIKNCTTLKRELKTRKRKKM